MSIISLAQLSCFRMYFSFRLKKHIARQDGEGTRTAKKLSANKLEKEDKRGNS